MTATSTKGAADLFSQAMKSFESALKTGVKVQEDSLKWWSEVAGEPRTVSESQTKVKEFLETVAPTARKNAEESLRAFDSISKNSLDLLNKAFEAGPGDSTDEVRKRVEKLWEDSLAALRKQTESVMDVNERVMKVWASCFEKAGAREEKPSSAKVK